MRVLFICDREPRYAELRVISPLKLEHSFQQTFKNT